MYIVFVSRDGNMNMMGGKANQRTNERIDGSVLMGRENVHAAADTLIGFAIDAAVWYANIRGQYTASDRSYTCSGSCINHSGPTAP